MSGTIEHSWNGTVLTITTDSGTSSCDLKGEKGDTGVRGAQGVAGLNGTVDTTILEIYSTKADTEAAIAEAMQNVDNSNFYTKEETEELIATEISKVDNSNYYTKEETEEVVNKAVDDIDLSSYYQKSEVFTKEESKGLIAYNLLDNSDFRNPVNQRGQNSYSGNTYSIDRWRAYHSDTTHTLTNEGLSVSGAYFNAYQVLDKNIIDLDKVYTAAASDSEGNITIWSGKITSTAGAVGVYISGTSILFRLVGEKVWKWAALYEGEYTKDTLPPYIPKGYQNELSQCYRYYYRASNDLGLFYPASYIGTNGIYFMYSLPTQLRVIQPTVTARLLRVVSLPDYSIPTGFTYSFILDGGNQLRIGATKTSHGLENCMFEINGIEISADL